MPMPKFNCISKVLSVKILTVLTFVVGGFFSCQSPPQDIHTLFNRIPPSQSDITFQNTLTETEEFNIIQYLYYYNGGGTAIGDINRDGLPDIFFTANQETNKLYLNQGNFTFKDITESAGVAGNFGANSWTTGVSMVDINRDGHLDIYVCEVGDYKHLKGRNRLYINNGGESPTFTESAEAYGLDFSGFGQQAAWLDYDSDGDTDVYLLNHSVHSAENYAKADIRNRRDSLSGDRLLRNDDGRFTDVSAEAGIYGSKIGFGLGVAVSDVNNDGCPDIYVSNDFHENDYLYYNNCDGTFREDIRGSTGHTSTFSMGTDIADLNNDGRPDILTLDMKPADEVILKSSVGADPYNIYQYKIRYGYHYQYPRNMLQLNRGNLRADGGAAFSEVGQYAGIAATDWSWSALTADYDLDGYPDVFVTNGIERRPNDLDYLKFLSSPIVQKQAKDSELTAKMPVGRVANQAFRGGADLQFAEVSEVWGLDAVGSSQGAAYADLDGDGDLDLAVNNLNAPAAIYRNQTVENQANNYLKITLPPGRTLGAKITVHTAAGEQMRELYPVRGWLSSSAPQAIFGLGQDSTAAEVIIDFGKGESYVLRKVRANTEVVFTGKGAKYQPQPTATQPIFTKSQTLQIPVSAPTGNDFDREKLLLRKISEEKPFRPGAIELPGVSVDTTPLNIAGEIRQLFPFLDSINARCHVRADFNGDGHADLFAGVRQVVGSYGIIPESFLYLSDETGNLTPHPLPADGKIGMVTDALWLPATSELVTVGDAMPVRIFRFAGNDISERGFDRRGWWNTVTAADLNADGSPELLLGNAGLNLDLRPTADAPVQLYVADYDGNGTTDPVTTRYRQGKEYTYAGKDELAMQLTAVRKKYTDYAGFARSDYAQIFADFTAEVAPLTVNTFASLVCDIQGNCRTLPPAVQYAPVQAFATDDFNGDGHPDVVAVGNFYGFAPVLGRADASYGVFLAGDGEGNLTAADPTDSGLAVFGDARTVKVLPPTDGKGRLAVVLRDGKTVIFTY